MLCGVLPPGLIQYCSQQDTPKECPAYDSKQSDGEASVTLEFCRMRSTPLLPSLQGLLWPGVVALDKVLSMGEIKLFDI